MTFNYFDNASFIGKKQTLGINNLSSINRNNLIPAAGWRRGGKNGSFGSYTFIVPAGVVQVSAVCVGGGGGGGGNNGVSGPGAGGGGAGGLAYGTFDVTPGENLTVIVGRGGYGGTQFINAGDGDASQIKRGSTVLLNGLNGTGGSSNVTSGGAGSGGGSAGTERDGGGNGGNGGPATNNGAGAGGGGAGGYSGNGGNGQGSGQNRTNGSGGGGAGGNAINSAPPGANGGGGGVGLDGQGSSGTVGNFTTVTGSVDSYSTENPLSNVAGKCGGGGGGTEDDTNAFGTAGGIGGVRIIWGFTEDGEPRSYPSTNTSQSVQEQNDETS